MALAFDHEKILTVLQADFVARLKSDRYFGEDAAPIPVYDERKGDVLNAISRSLGILTDAESSGKLGTCVVVMSPVATVENPELAQGPLSSEWEFRVLEDVTLNTDANGIGKAAFWTARRIVRLMHHYTPFGLGSTMIARKPTIIPVEDPVAPVAYAVRFVLTEATIYQEGKTATPSITVAGAGFPKTVTLECVTAGASIYYTTDGETYPWSEGAGALLYSAPFEVAAAATVRACAFAEDKLPSNVQMSVIT